ncbi:hypothetical protein GCM10029976_042140 [Kribbella albertanoniae]|uniref:NUDIX domain-containing protein n=2 Tax=Kribbella albertanoniae TaxID=1266829 RepID=A0A4R4QET4_9ACTN|nr:NUDIX domain-containing protein [Kribbella albertanoniae]TDC34004.1 NUDIX domain-containing protein [Kribbella albertanoniae]
MWAFGLLRRSDDEAWQGIAGRGEYGEKPFEAAMRETEEEAGWRASQVTLFDLDTFDCVRADCLGARTQWPAELYVVPQYYFAIDAGRRIVKSKVGRTYQIQRTKPAAFQSR